MSYQALGVVFGPCLIRLDPMQMIEMWDSRICEEIFGNFGAIVEDISETELAVCLSFLLSFFPSFLLSFLHPPILFHIFKGCQRNY